MTDKPSNDNNNVIYTNCPQNNMLLTAEQLIEYIKEGRVAGLCISAIIINDKLEELVLDGEIISDATNVYMLAGQLEKQKQKVLEYAE